MRLQDSVVLITGASSGFGAATALRCAAGGARLVLAARSAAPLDDLAATIRRGGGEAVALPADVTRDDDVARLVEAAVVRFGRIDVLVNNAGFGLLNSVGQAPLAELESQLSVNLVGVARCIEAVLPQMLPRRHGMIVNVASLAGLLGMPNLAYYSATKAGLIGMSRALQQDLKGSGVRCVIVCPGAARTPFFRRADISKMPRTSLLIPWLADVDVARVIARAIERGRDDEIITPALATPLIRLAGATPWLARLVVRLVG